MLTRRAVLYARVSTDGHTTRTQLRELEAVARRHHWHVVHRFVDQGISGARGREQRPQFEALHQAIARRECEVVLVWSVDRLGRSLSDLMGLLNELHAKHIDLYLHRQGIDTTTPAGKMLFQMLGVFAEFQRSLIQERVRAGLARARAQGTQLGRPRVPLSVEAAVRKARATGTGIRRIAQDLHIGVGTVKRIVDGGPVPSPARGEPHGHAGRRARRV
jgi:DNA invertase Pin-like site-specific DNA recombinase